MNTIRPLTRSWDPNLLGTRHDQPLQLHAGLRPELPAKLLAALSGHRGRYTDYLTLFHAIQISPSDWLGVVGDGDNGSYEWFYFDGQAAEFSASGYGMSTTALREVLTAYL